MQVFGGWSRRITCLGLFAVLPSVFAAARAELTVVLPIQLEGLPSERVYVLPECDVLGEAGRPLQQYGEKPRWHEWTPLLEYPSGKGEFKQSLEVTLGFRRYEFISGWSTPDGFLLSAIGEGEPDSISCRVKLYFIDDVGYREFPAYYYRPDQKRWGGRAIQCGPLFFETGMRRSNCESRRSGPGDYGNFRMYSAKGAPAQLIVKKKLKPLEAELLKRVEPGSALAGSCSCGCGGSGSSQTGCRSPQTVPQGTPGQRLLPCQCNDVATTKFEKFKVSQAPPQKDQVDPSKRIQQQLEAARLTALSTTGAAGQIARASDSPKLDMRPECVILDDIFYRGTGLIEGPF